MKTAIKKFAIDLRIRVGYGTAFILLFLSYMVTLYANSELLKRARLVDHSSKLILHMEGMLSSLKDAETGMRGYLLMNDSSFLEPYEQSKHTADSLLRILQYDTRQDPERRSSLATLELLMKKNYELMDFAVSNFAAHHYQLTDTLKGKNFFGEEIMDRIRSTGKEVQLAEETRLKERTEEMTSRYYYLDSIIISSLTLALLMVLYSFYIYSRENKARRAADQQVFQYQEQLKERITQLDRANKELIQMRSIEKFAATGRIARTIAHEVRNPLTNINLAVDQLKSEYGNEQEDHTLMLDMINRNSLRINQLITDLLNSTKFSELEYRKLSINDILDATLELAKDRILLNNITVTKKYDAGICDVQVDEERIKIAFLNIIVNAIEAMEAGKGILQIATTARNNKCVVMIKDNGPGIDKDSLSKLFEPYFSGKAKGTGLGLTNTQNIILNHKGQISIESEPGQGATFAVTLDFA